jgi:DNA-directed RNA polymerase subunit E'
MYKSLTVQDEVRVPPSKFDLDVKNAVLQSLQETLEGSTDATLGVFLAVTEVLDVGEGKILPEDGSIHYPCKYTVLVYLPIENEVFEGEVVDLTEFGAFVRLGPLDGLVHVSQIMNDKVNYDAKNAILTGRDRKKALKEGDVVRARITGVSLGKSQTKITLTMRQPCLGALSWIEAEKKEAKKAVKAAK